MIIFICIYIYIYLRQIHKIMKKIIILLVLFVGLLAHAQYYNPYQQAYEYGQQLARQQQQANQQAYNWGYAMGLVQSGQRLIAQGKYEEGYDKFWEAWNTYEYAPALECLGVCYEVGIGTERDLEWADMHYEEGARLNDANCKAAVSRINSNGHYPASYKSTIISNLQARYGTGNSNSGGYVPTPNYNAGNSSSGNSSVYSTCRICGGSGVCTSCHGTGGEWRDTGYYTGSGNKSWINCPSCNGKGKQ